jgi:hypothetical protein
VIVNCNLEENHLNEVFPSHDFLRTFAVLFKISLKKEMKKLILPLFAVAITLNACKKDNKEVELVGTEPEVTCNTGSYCFLRDGNITVDYAGQTARLNQLEELTTYMKSGNTPNTVLDLDVLNDMFSNADGAGSIHFSADAAASGKQLENKCFLGTIDSYYDYFLAIEIASMSITAGSNGVAGVVTSTVNSSKQYLLDENGFEHIQLIEKGLMGDVFYFQATDTYLVGTENGNYDNVAIADAAAGKHYTEAEHKFDEAFGYFGVSSDFPTNTEGVRFHGKYCNARDAALGTNAIMDAFIGCRTAITANTDVAPFTAALRTEWHRTIAGTAISYLKLAKENINDPAIKCHELSEAYAFIGNLLHNTPELALTPAQVQEARDLMGSNFYDTTEDELDATISFLIDNTLIEFIDLISL